MGLFDIAFGKAMGYRARDVARWQRECPEGVTRRRLLIAPGDKPTNVPILTAIRHIQNTYGQSADTACEQYFGELMQGEIVPTGCGNFYYVHEPSYEKRKASENTSCDGSPQVPATSDEDPNHASIGEADTLVGDMEDDEESRQAAEQVTTAAPAIGDLEAARSDDSHEEPDEDPLTSILLDARHLVAWRLVKTTSEWGPRDFPEDNGIATRNYLFAYADSFIGLIDFQLSERSKDQWMKEIKPYLLRLSPEQMMRVIGLACFHSQLLTWHGKFSTLPAMASQELVNKRVQVVQAWCNWIYVVHDLPSECASAWYKCLMETDSAERAQYEERSQAVMQRYLGMLTPFKDTSADSALGWTAQGWHADFETRKQEPGWISDIASFYFKEHFGLPE